MNFYFLSMIFVCMLAATKNNTLGKVVGGENAKQGEFPYLVTLMTDEVPTCTGTLVAVDSVQIIITSETCLKSPPETVVAGDLKRSDISGLEQTRTVKHFILHSDSDDAYFGNEIAIVFLEKPFDLNENVNPISLPPLDLSNPTGNVVITGWGNYSTGFDDSFDILQKVEVPVWDQAACNETYFGIPEHNFCIGAIQKGACFRDIGGPVCVPGVAYFVGVIVSDIDPCTEIDKNKPIVTTNMSPFVEWVKSEVAKLTNKNKSSSGCVWTSIYNTLIVLILGSIAIKF